MTGIGVDLHQFWAYADLFAVYALGCFGFKPKCALKF